MSEEHFEFAPGGGPRSIRITFRGFWDAIVVERYRSALRQRAVSALGSSPINRVLLDMRECSIQSQDVMDSFEKIIEGYASQIEHYGMLLPESALLKIQMKRLMLPTSVIFFDSEEDALEWLSR